MEFWKSRKGVEPLIAAVLLIVIVVGIGAVVTGIVRNYVTEGKQTITEKASDMKCGVEVMINVPTVAEEQRICGNVSEVQFTLENAGSAIIDQLQVKFFTDTGFYANDTVLNSTLESNFGPGETYAFTVPSTASGTLQEIKIVPRVKVVGRTEKAYCTDAALTFADIDLCG
jgi:archaellum component FlaF (FlaF/FlaG flagellin family)